MIIFLNFAYFYKKKIDLLFLIIGVSFFTFILVTLSNVNRPDAGLYHLPYISLLNESKIIIGSTNIHYRFGHTSLIQYLSAIYNNYLFKIEFINIPLASIFSFYIFFIINQFLINLKKNSNEKTFIQFLIIIFSLYAFNRYSNYGNDALIHIFYFILVTMFIEIKNIKKTELNEFYKVVIVSVFLLSLKPFMIIAFLLPIIIFYLSKEKIFLIKKNSFIYQ